MILLVWGGKREEGDEYAPAEGEGEEEEVEGAFRFLAFFFVCCFVCEPLVGA